MASDQRISVKQKMLHFLIWLALGLVCVVSVSVAHLTHAGLFDEFYNIGDVRDYRDWNIVINVSEEDFYYGLPIGENTDKWNYMSLTISDSSSEKVAATFNVVKNDEILDTCEAELKDGRNLVKIKNVEFDTITMRIQAQAGTSFNLVRFQLRDHKPVADLWRRMGKRCVFFGIIYILVSSLAVFLYRRSKIRINWDAPADALQRFYVFLGNELKWIPERIPEQGKSVLRCAVFLFLMIYFNLKTLQKVFHVTFFQHTIICSVLLLLIAVLCLNKKIEKQEWHSGLVRSWIWLSVLMIISDFFVEKKWMYNGLVLLLVFGFLAFAWNSMQNRDLLIKEFSRAVHIYFICVAVFCFLCRPDVLPRYTGTLTNSVTFSAYITFISAIALAEIVQMMSQRRFCAKGIFFAVEFLVSVFLGWKTQSRTGILALIVLIVLLLVRQSAMVLKRKKVEAAAVWMLLLIVLLFVPIFRGGDYLLKHLPEKLGTEIQFYDGEFPADIGMKDMGTVVSVKDSIMLAQNQEESEVGIRNSRVWESLQGKDLNAISSGRIQIWKEYLCQLNLWGHERNPVILGKRQYAHNSLLQIAYQFGVFAVIPYAIMLFFVLKKSMVFVFPDLKRRNDVNMAIPFAVIIIYIVFSMLNPAEALFDRFTWVGFYFMIGIFFGDGKTTSFPKAKFTGE